MTYSSLSFVTSNLPGTMTHSLSSLTGSRAQKPLSDADITTRIEIEKNWLIFTINWRGRQVGYALCVSEGETLTISDFEVEAELPIPSFPFLTKYLNVKRNFRRQGIGTALMHLVIITASDRKMTRICGRVGASELENFPGLMEWLGTFGFEKTVPAEDAPAGTVWMIGLEL